MRDELTTAHFVRMMMAAAVFGIGIGVLWRVTGFAALLLIPVCMFPVRTSNGAWSKSFTIDLPYLWTAPTREADLIEWRRHRRVFALVVCIAVLVRVVLAFI
ncbi:hypothetical protein [Komagataeibacter europaeus]|uniref:hypothetical protein n=1 Tax=Komagataeibacter europaeus TaxID=33995 RepID=UPI0002E203C1|nr:hypothetical protein [Komagataeibacter europaeus]GBQ46740.1 hypothetical protein AA18890_2656 [Komagataeibacter europaeus LMG 18890]